MTKKVYCLWEELSSLLSVAVECTEKEFEEIKNVYISNPNVQHTLDWINNNYILLKGKTVRVRKS